MLGHIQPCYRGRPRTWPVSATSIVELFQTGVFYSARDASVRFRFLADRNLRMEADSESLTSVLFGAMCLPILLKMNGLSLI